MKRMRDWPIEDIMLLAMAKLNSEDTITTYIMVDGVECRRPANMWASLIRAIGQVGEKFVEKGKEFNKITEAFLNVR
jgi:hypothetical protein